MYEIYARVKLQLVAPTDKNEAAISNKYRQE